MSSEFQPNNFRTENGGVLQRITKQAFDENEHFAIVPPELHEGIIYKAHGTSRWLERSDSAVSFDVQLSNIERISGLMAGVSFTLALLNDDFQPLDIHHAEIWSDGRWHIPAPHVPIYVKKQGFGYGFLDKLKTGYITKHDDDTINDLIDAYVFNDAPKGEPEPKGPQGSHPLYPTDEQ